MNTNDLALFIQIADNNSISRAAEQLDISTATASAALQRLEKQLQAQLFIRSTRRLRITAAGERFLIYCREALSQLDAGKASLHALQGKVAGELRISAPSDLGRNLLLDWIDEIMAQHQDLSISLTLGDSIADFFLDNIDLAIRYGALEDSSMVAFKLAETEGILCASPSYLAKHGSPQQPNDLSQHNCLLYQRNNRLHDLWEFSASSAAGVAPVKVSVSGDRSSNDSEVVRRWAVAGRGIAYKSHFDMADDLRHGRVVRVLADYALRPAQLHLICPNRKQITPAMLLLRDIFRDKFAQLNNQQT
ncbi:LysR family transcriptional regulator [Dasania sp. GY-MA-18]|uniref:LysR family transcriptional regulator n=1 Tax=Dasania phycosphaerae TaxID=2950436 RepID=A0A9J6RNG3_9GAMM|nr:MULTISPECIES: LysR family transcriptional regulator [Dasania]MCR8923836.1 LysR family transcriptional regulator [Dasania sp. GY-MA-18]MCZ0866270.1 LysR family transcriptional regulator [Dasania phycosphaerae]MCZ0869994.1 LysR family transcriptional regulator [Dasania phycosphaerae]